uniref:ZP domain-containing protein n=1 Tax=Elaeophora elaphi TaxID=1147741 RepID=A0A0R3RQ27_9BILA
MRGCVNRFLLFGLDEDVRDALTDRSECRATDRRLLHLVALTPQTDLTYSSPFYSLSLSFIPGDNVLMYGLTVQLCQHGPHLVDRHFLCLQHIPSDAYVDSSLHYALLHDNFLIPPVIHLKFN